MVVLSTEEGWGVAASFFTDPLICITCQDLGVHGTGHVSLVVPARGCVINRGGMERSCCFFTDPLLGITCQDLRVHGTGHVSLVVPARG